MNARNPHNSSTLVSTWRRRVASLAALILMLLILGACADDDSERRFANDPIPTEDLTNQPTLPPDERAPTQSAVAATPIPLGQLLAQVGASSVLYAQSGSNVVVIPLDGSAPRIVFTAEQGEIAAVAGSTDGGRVAVVTTLDSGTATLDIVSSTGEPMATVELNASTASTPSPATGRGVVQIAWSPSGAEMLITLATGGIVEYDAGGVVRQVVSASSAPSPLAVAWSPSGGAIAYVDAGPTGAATGLYVASTDVLPVDPVAVIRPLEGRSRQIVEIAWPAGGAGILYAERALDGDLSVGGDLFAISPNGGSPRLVASAGRVTQVGAVDEFSIAPGGDAVAFTVALVGGGDGVVSNVLRVKQIGGSTSAELTFRDGSVVAALGWTTAGLTWAATESTADGSTGIVVQRARSDGGVETLYSDLPQATPVASPAASPVPASDDLQD